MIQRDLNPAGRLWNLIFGLAQIADGIIRVVSLGFLHTRFCLTVSREQSRRAIQNLKKGN